MSTTALMSRRLSSGRQSSEADSQSSARPTAGGAGAVVTDLDDRQGTRVGDVTTGEALVLVADPVLKIIVAV